MENWQDKATMSVPEVCRVLGISRSLGFKMVQRGELPAIRLGQKRLIVPTSYIIRMLEQTEKN